MGYIYSTNKSGHAILNTCYLLHGGHLVPLPVVVHLAGQAAGQDDPGQLEDDDHGQGGGNSRDTALQ